MTTAINTNLAALISTVEKMADALVVKYNGKGIYREISESDIEWIETGITVPPVTIATSAHDEDGHLWCLCYDDGQGFYMATSNPLTPEGVEVETDKFGFVFRAGDAEISVEEKWGEKTDWTHFLLCPWHYNTYRVRVGDRKLDYGRDGGPRNLEWTGMWVDEMSPEEYHEIRRRRVKSAIRFREETEAAFGLSLG